MEKILLLLARCKCGVHIGVNDHRNDYESAKQHLETASMGDVGSLHIPADVRAIMEATDTVVSVVFYPDTPVGFYRIYHYNLAQAIDLALSCLPDPADGPAGGQQIMSATQENVVGSAPSGGVGCEPERPHPMLCFDHGGSPSAKSHNMWHGFDCPKCVASNTTNQQRPAAPTGDGPPSAAPTKDTRP